MRKTSISGSLVIVSCVVLTIARPSFSRDFFLGPITLLEQVTEGVPNDIRAGDGVVVWSWSPNSSSSNICAYDFDNGTLVPVRSGEASVHRPDTSSRTVIWSEKVSGVYQVMVYDLDSGQHLQVTTGDGGKAYPSIEDGIAVFEKVRPDGWRDIYTAQEPGWNSFPLLNDPTATQTGPDISNGRVIYSYRKPGTSTNAMRVYDLGTQQVVYEIGQLGGGDGTPCRIAGDTIAWSGSSGYDYYTKVVEMGSGQEWVINHWGFFALRQDVVVYNDAGEDTIYLRDLVDGTTSVLRDNMIAMGPDGLAIDGDRLIWCEYLGDDTYAVYAAPIIPEPVALSLLAVGAVALIRRRRK